MAIDKGLYAAPMGIEQMAQEEEPLEIAIEDPESVKVGIDGLEIEFEKGEGQQECDYLSTIDESPSKEYSSVVASNVMEQSNDKEKSSVSSPLVYNHSPALSKQSLQLEAFDKTSKQRDLTSPSKPDIAPLNGTRLHSRS